MKKLILLGGGGHCLSVIDCIDVGSFNLEGILDPNEKLNEVGGVKILGTDDKIGDFSAEYGFHITIGMASISNARYKKFLQLKESNFSIETIISTKAYLEKNVLIGTGSTLMHGAIVNSCAQIGENTIINTRSIIEHEAKIGSHSHISTGAIVNGGCKIGDHCMIGSGAIIKHGVTIANSCIIGAGAVVTKNIQSPGTYVGIPAKPIQKW